MAVWVEATSYEWYCDECGQSDGGFESPNTAQQEADEHDRIYHFREK